MRRVIVCIIMAILTVSSVSLSSAQTAEQLKMYQEFQKQKGNDIKFKNLNGETNQLNQQNQQNQLNQPANRNHRQTPLTNNQSKIRIIDADTTLRLTIHEKDSLDKEYLRMKLMRDKRQVFGREIFDRKNISFAPSLNIPTPSNYILGAGDQVFIDIWGDTQKSYDLVISPDGDIVVPQVGLMHIGGLTVSKAQALISKQFENSVEGLNSGSASIKLSLGTLRSIKVNIIGEAGIPGTYTLPSLASLFNALYSAGGVSDIGSLRDIKLFRHGKQIATLDVYDYLLKGDNKVDMRLEDGDLIVIAPYTGIVTLTGKVKRERLYEMKEGETLADLIEYAGGFDGDAYTESLNVSRSNGKQREIFTLPTSKFKEFTIQNRDSVSVGEVSDKYSNRVKIAGAVWRPGTYGISENVQTVADLIGVADGLKEDAYLGRGQLIRLQPDLTKEVIPFNISKLLDKTAPDILLQKDDSLSIVSIDKLRQARTVAIRGEVNDTTGTIPFVDNMTIEDAIMTVSGLKESASKARLEVFRRIKNPNSTTVSDRKAEVFSFTIPEDLSLVERAANFTLEPFDELIIRRSPGYSAQQQVFVEGEVLFGGEYAMTSSNETIVDLIKRAGGLTPEAYSKGASLKRLITKDDIERIKSLAKLSSKGGKDTVFVDRIEIGTYESVGINLEDALANPAGFNNVVLKVGDILTIPTYNNTVKISGAVNYPNTTTYIPKTKLKEYISMGGGYAKLARKTPFVIYMNGTVAAVRGGKIPKIEPGCQIVIPSRPQGENLRLGDIVGISTSVVSTMAMLTTMFK